MSYDATDVYAAAAALIRDNYPALAVDELEGLTVAWGNENGDEGALHIQVPDGTSVSDTTDMEGGSIETVIMQVDVVTPAGDFTARNRKIVKWLTGLFYVGRRVGPAMVQRKPYTVAPDPDDADYRVPVTLTFTLVT